MRMVTVLREQNIMVLGYRMLTDKALSLVNFLTKPWRLQCSDLLRWEGHPSVIHIKNYPVSESSITNL